MTAAFFVITVVRIVASWRSMPKLQMDIKSLSPLIVLIVRDGALFYFLLFVILLFSIIAIKVPEGVPLNPFMLVLLRVSAYSWSGSRLMLNLREAMNRTSMGASTLARQTMITPVFAPNPMLRHNQGTVTESVA
ncbi:hypothetical protein J3R82DRAFT_9165 [Butyriboletus roseoflavus]|nr:hypothetical protein J3R82DRAFT_9165 [Butyriboletus roseoflavus]